MENLTMFWNKYGGAVIGFIVGLILSMLLIFTDFYKLIIAIIVIVACVWCGNYFQRNKDNVKEKTKGFIDKL